jgi:hypothetical protein
MNEVGRFSGEIGCGWVGNQLYGPADSIAGAASPAIFLAFGRRSALAWVLPTALASIWRSSAFVFDGCRVIDPSLSHAVYVGMPEE